MACSELELNFECTCDGCACNDPPTLNTTAATDNEVLSTTTTSTTTERVFSPANGDDQFTGTAPLEDVPTTTTFVCPPGHICDVGAPPTTTTQPVESTLLSCSSNLIADSFCDDEYNNQLCDWDGGDCCGAAILKVYCTDCLCLDPALAPYYNCGANKNTTTCEHPQWESDGYCDDANNNCKCNWDGGDCCGSDNAYNYCTECECLDIAYSDATCHKGCATPAYSGDDFCDDENNNCGCDWDGGDCCGKNKHSTYCDVCACLDPDAQIDADHENCVQACDSLTFYADGFCDDANNVCGCDWDGGDCCGGSVDFRYCTECNCLDPNFVCPGT